MGMETRTYWREDPQSNSRNFGFSFRLGFPRPGKAIKALLLINVAVFILQSFWDPQHLMRAWLGVTVGGYWQAWRYLTFQFLHADFGHIFMNMLGLYMIGTSLENYWGPRRFIAFYLICGVAAGAAYVLMGHFLGLPPRVPIIGASGGVCGVVMACAILFPQMRLIFIIFPMSIRLAAAIIFGAMIFGVIQDLLGSAQEKLQAMSNIAHLGGALAAAAWLYGPGLLRNARVQQPIQSEPPSHPRPFVTPSVGTGTWQRKVNQRAEEEVEVDRILEKIHTQGVASLTRAEKDLLQQATKRQKEEEDRIRRL